MLIPSLLPDADAVLAVITIRHEIPAPNARRCGGIAIVTRIGRSRFAEKAANDPDDPDLGEARRARACRHASTAVIPTSGATH